MRNFVFIATAILFFSSSSPINSQTISTSLKDDEECKAGSDCTCGFVTCEKGCTCEMTGPTGICTDCPIPEVPTGVFGSGNSGNGSVFDWKVSPQQRSKKSGRISEEDQKTLQSLRSIIDSAKFEIKRIVNRTLQEPATTKKEVKGKETFTFTLDNLEIKNDAGITCTDHEAKMSCKGPCPC